MSTVGYGEFAGTTKIEYLSTLILEFGGLLVFAFLSFFLMKIQTGSFDYDQFLTEKFDQLEVWTANIESLNQKQSIDTALLLKIRKAASEAIQFDFNEIIEDFNFYQSMPVKLQSKLVQKLFGHFVAEFTCFFEDLERGFINELVMNLFSRSYEPGETIIEPGKTVTSLMFITKGHLAVCEPS